MSNKMISLDFVDLEIFFLKKEMEEDGDGDK